jgi:hypothetical protein
MARKKKALKKKAPKAKSGDKIAGRSRANRGVTSVRDVSSHHKVDIGRVRPAESIETAQNTRDGRAVRTRWEFAFLRPGCSGAPNLQDKQRATVSFMPAGLPKVIREEFERWGYNPQAPS